MGTRLGPNTDGGEIIREALVHVGLDAEKGPDYSPEQGSGVYVILNTIPVVQLCDLLAQKLEERGYRIMRANVGRVKPEELLENRK